MITKVVLGNGAVLQNVEEIQEIVQNNGDYIYNGLTLNISKDSAGEIPNISDIEKIFSQTNVLDGIKIYKKDVISVAFDEATQENVTIYTDEYLCLDTSQYTGVQSIYKCIDLDKITVQLSADPTKMADDKYNTLIAENEKLEQTILEMSMLLGGD